MTKIVLKQKKYFEYLDKVLVLKGTFKGKIGIVTQIMPLGSSYPIGVDVSGKHIYYKENQLKNLTED